MRLNTQILTGVAIAGLIPSQALAAPISNQEAAALLERLNQLEQEVVSLRAQLGTVETVQQHQTKKYDSCRFLYG